MSALRAAAVAGNRGLWRVTIAIWLAAVHGDRGHGMTEPSALMISSEMAV